MRMKVKKERNRREGDMKMTIKQRRKDNEHESDINREGRQRGAVFG